MTATTIRVQMAQRKDTAANWTSANPILLSGEIGYETDTKKFKIGNGSSNWNSLAYLPIPDGSGNLTITGNLEIGNTGSLTFEGSTADGFETTLAVTNPTADRTITLPDRSGTVITSGDTGTVTNAMLATEIAVSKLANGTANQIITTDGTDVSWSNNLNLVGNNIEIGVVATPTDVTADGGGITLRGITNKTINWSNATSCWTSSENFDLAAGKSYFIDGAEVINSTSLGNNITDSSLTSVGTLGSLTVSDFVFAGTFIPESTTAPFMGMYAPAANTLGFATDSVQRITIDPNGNLTINAQSDLRFADSDSSNWVAFQAPATVASNVTWTLPSADGTSGQVLNTNGSGTLGWTSATSTNTASAIVARDASGNFTAGTITANLTGTASAIADSSVTDAKVSATAAIAGTKISPDFGSQNVTTTGTATAASLIPSSSTVPTNGIYLPAANTVGISTNGTGRLFVDASGRLGIGTTSASQKLHIADSSAAFTRYESGSFDAYVGQRSSGILEIAQAQAGNITLLTSGSERCRVDSSGRFLVGTSSKSATASTTAKGIVGIGGGGGIICAEGQIANNGTIDITVGTSGIHYFTGLLQVNNISASNGANRTQSLISILGDNQGGTISTSTLHTANGTGSRSFTITYVATGILRFTNNSGDTCNVQITYMGGGINAS